MSTKGSAGLALKVDGEREFKQALGDIGSNFKVLNSELKLATAEFGKNNTELAALTKTNDIYNRRITEQKEKVAVTTKALENARQEFGENAQKTKEWESKLNLANGELITMEKELRGLNLQAFSDGMTKAKGGLDNLVSGFKLAAGAGLAVGGAIFGMAANAAKTADDLNTLSAKTGLTTQQLQELQYASGFVDVELSTMTDSMGKIVKSMSGANDATKGTGAAFSTLGVEVRGSDGSLRDSRTVWEETISALGGVANETERDALAMQLFGKSAQELNPLIKAGGEEMKRLAAEANGLGIVLSDEAIAKSQKLDDSMQKLKASGGALVTNLGAELVPIVQKFADKLLAVDPKKVAELISGIIENAPVVISLLGGVAAGFVAFNVSSMIMGVTTAIKGFSQGLTLAEIAQKAFNFAMAANPVGLIVAGVAAILAGLYTLYKTSEPFKKWVDDTFGWLVDMVTGAFDWIGKVTGGIKALFGSKEKNNAATNPPSPVADAKNVVATSTGKPRTVGPAAGNSSMANTIVNQTTQIDGKTVAKSTSKYQAGANTNTIRAYGR